MRDPHGWKADYGLDGRSVHLRPHGDAIWHPLDEDCLCGPTTCAVVTPGPVAWMYLHHALDGRPQHKGTITPAGAPTDPPDGPDECYA